MAKTKEKEELSTQRITINEIESKILNIRNLQVMMDRDLAELYGVETKRLNQAVKRNIERFPESFRFQLNSKEKYNRWSKFVTTYCILLLLM